MAKKEDKVFFAGYGLVIMMIGLVVGLYSTGFFDGGTAFSLWLLFTSFILVGLGSIKTESAPQGSMALVGSGIALLIISVGLLGIFYQIIHPITAIAILIVFIGLAVIGMGMRRA
jgi:hypothetical protein